MVGWSRASGNGRRLHRRFGPLCTAAWAERDGPAASHPSVCRRRLLVPASTASGPARQKAAKSQRGRVHGLRDPTRTAVARVRFVAALARTARLTNQGTGLAPVVLRAAMAGRSRSSCTCEMTHPGKPGTGGRPRQRPGAPPVCHPSRRKARPEKGRTQCPSRRNENRRRSRASCPQSSGSASQVAEDAVHRARARLVRFNSHGLPVCCARAFRPTAATECCLTSPARVATLRAWSFEPTGLQPR